MTLTAFTQYLLIVLALLLGLVGFFVWQHEKRLVERIEKIDLFARGVLVRLVTRNQRVIMDNTTAMKGLEMHLAERWADDAISRGGPYRPKDTKDTQDGS